MKTIAKIYVQLNELSQQDGDVLKALDSLVSEMKRQTNLNQSAISVEKLVLLENGALPQNLDGKQIEYLYPPNVDESFIPMTKIVIRKLRANYLNNWVTRDTCTKKNLKMLERLELIYISNFQNPNFSMSELGKFMHMSRSPLQKKLKLLINETPVGYLRAFRLEFAKIMLDKDNSNIKLIASSVGFRSTSYFCHCYKIHFGCTPKNSILR